MFNSNEGGGNEKVESKQSPVEKTDLVRRQQTGDASLQQWFQEVVSATSWLQQGRRKQGRTWSC